MKRIILLVLICLVATTCAAAPKFAKHQLNKTPLKSTLGMNGNFFNQDLALLNAVKYGLFMDTRLSGSGTGETAGLLQNDVDANGYPLTMSFTSTFTACISSVSGACGGSSGTIVWISALVSGKPWHSGGLSGAGGGGVTAGTVMTVATGAGTAAVTGGNLLTVSGGVTGVFGPGMVIFDADGHQYGVISSNGTGTGGTGTYNLTSGVNIASTTLNARQDESLPGTYIASASQHVTSTTITETNRFTSVQIDTLLGISGITTPNGQVYQSGTWVFAYDGGDGTTTFTFNNDFSGMAKCTGVGRYVATNVTGFGGTDLAETVIGSPHTTNWRLIYSPGSSCTGCPSSCTVGTNEALWNAGEVFSPDYVDRMKPFKAFRMMNWQSILSTTMGDWTYRRSPTWIFWEDSPSVVYKYHGGSGITTADGVPIEAQVALCNKINADCWFNIPPLATDTYITNMATLVHNGTTDSDGHIWAGLNSGLKAYVEFGNEFWNFVFCDPPGGNFTEDCSWAIADLDISFYPQNTGFSNNPFNAMVDYQGLQSVRSANMWRTAFGADSARVIGIYGGAIFDYNPSGTVQSSTIWGTATTDPGPNNIGPTYYTGTKASNLNALAVAPYIGNGGCPGADLNAFFAQAATDEAAAVVSMAGNKTFAANNSLNLLGYESGFQYTGGAALCVSAMRDARAGTMYTGYYNDWRSNSASIIMHFDDVGPWNSSGFYQVLESITETTSPRYEAIKNFHN